ncbi:uncharacterized protein LOC117648062 [Thrips palmi]|uniref:Uncharacterized protein LOC117648062 n=1 Tax=Thrips palmi TaxID=161013 RepID=A0A6P8ZQM6_THRPL|nr:uncharacterized protein LOC117648062 [Thrips palmi]
MQITAQHAAKKQEAEKAPDVAVPHTVVPMPAVTPKAAMAAPRERATITQQTVVLLSVLAILAMALYPFIVLRLAIMGRIFDGLAPNVKPQDHSPSPHITDGSFDLRSDGVVNHTDHQVPPFADETPSVVSSRAPAGVLGEEVIAVPSEAPVGSPSKTPSGVSSKTSSGVSGGSSSEGVRGSRVSSKAASDDGARGSLLVSRIASSMR